MEARESPRAPFLLAAKSRALVEHTQPSAWNHRGRHRAPIPTPSAQVPPVTAPPGARSGAHRQEAKQRLVAPEAPAAPSQRHTSVLRPGHLSASSGLRPRLGPPACSPHPAAQATSPASGQRPTTRGRRRRASSSWAGVSGGDRDNSQRRKSQDPGVFQSPSGAPNGRHALTATRSDGAERRHTQRRAADQPGRFPECAPPTWEIRGCPLGVVARVG